MTLQRYATTAGAASGAMPQQSGVPARELVDGHAPVVRDLRGRGPLGPFGLDFAPGDVVVVSGLPGSGKSTLIRRTARQHAIDSQDTRDRWETVLPALLPYALYRPLVRAAHYAGLLRTLRAGGPVVVHDCGTQTWVRRWLAREARRRGSALHLVLLDVTPWSPDRGSGNAAAGVRLCLRPAPPRGRPAAARHGERTAATGVRLGGAARPGDGGGDRCDRVSGAAASAGVVPDLS